LHAGVATVAAKSGRGLATRRGPGFPPTISARHALLLATLSIAWCATALADNRLPGQAGIASAHPLATQAGEEMLAAGGNAFDAAVAISAALGVVEPTGSGLGGGGFWLLHLAADGRQVLVDGREVAPAAATRDMYLDATGEPIPGSTLDGPLAAGIPGLPAALVHIAARYGRLPLPRSLAPAIRYARDGFPATRGIELGLRFRASAAARSPAFGRVFMPEGKPLKAGMLLRQPDLARTLQRLARDGVAGFYSGKTARQLVDGARAAGGIWALEDLARYRVIERTPTRFTYRGVTVVSAPPPSSGGLVLGNSLNILAGFDLPTLDGATRKHVVIEALRRAYRDRSVYLADPDFVAIPTERLLNPFYADGQRTTIRLDHATPSKDFPGVWPLAAGGAQTSHFSVIDRDGNRVAGTQSINTWYGAAFIPPGTGVILNNEMDDFVVRPGVPNGFELIGGEANRIEPGKRMLSSMSPTFLESDRGIAVLGTPGGSRIISMVLLATLAWIDGADAAAMVALPRYHHQYFPDVVSYEQGALADDEVATLRAYGHKLAPSARPWGNMQVVTWDYGSGKVEAASDPRGQGDVTLY
jgi:gamma-glutamyltranspeptidase/glutathione hydrolase